MLNKNAGDSFTLTAVYSDPKDKTVPLASLPVAIEKTGVIILTAVGTPTVNDASFQFTGTIPTDAAPGTEYEFDITAEGDPTPGADTIPGSFLIGVVADEDTKVVITGV